MTMYYPLIDKFRYRMTTMAHQPPFFLHTHHKYEIYFFHSGKCQYRLGSNLIDLIPGDVILMNGMTEHGPVLDFDQPYVRTTILFDKAYIKPLLNHPDMVDVLQPFEELGNVHLRPDHSTVAEMEQILNKMKGCYKKPDPVAYNRLKVKFMDLLLLLFELSRKPAMISPLVNKEKSVQSVIAFIEENYTKHITMNLLEEQLFISRYYLMRMFKERMGMTIFDYLKQRRIHQAMFMLKFDPDLSVTNVCYKVGFRHPVHFSRTFKQFTGSSPEQYRRLAKP